jgi:hypothetical protein
MAKDPVDFVRQGALIALGMILVQQSEAASPASVSTRAMYNKIIGDKHEDPMARFGAALGQGLIDAGGRNVTISLQSCAGSRNMNAIIGMALFCQFWYWYPLAHCVALAFEPTAIIGLTENLKVCPVRVVCGDDIEDSVFLGTDVRVYVQRQAQLVRLSSTYQAPCERSSGEGRHRRSLHYREGKSPRKGEERKGRGDGDGRQVAQAFWNCRCREWRC